MTQVWLDRLRQRRRLLLGTTSVVLLMIAYHLLSSHMGSRKILVPPISEIGAAFVEVGPTLVGEITASMKRVLAGFLIGSSVGVALGMVMGWFVVADEFLDPIVGMLRPVPPLAWIPLAILWLGIGEQSKIAVITVSAFLICIVNVITGVKNCPRIYIEAARMLGAREYQLFLHIVLPAALPFILTGLRISLQASWGTLVAAELIAAERGLGAMLTNARRFLRTDVIFVGVICIGVIAYLMDKIVYLGQARATSWLETRE